MDIEYEPCSICEEYMDGVTCDKNECPVWKIKAENKRLREGNKWFADLGKMYSEIRAEAVREFAEKVKETTYHYYDSDIDELVKEMDGDQNGKKL